MSNLPSWPGASVVYSRVGLINSKRALAAFMAQKMPWNKLSPAKKRATGFKFSVPDDITTCIEAMNKGDEEALKAYLGQHLHMLSAEELAETRE